MSPSSRRPKTTNLQEITAAAMALIEQRGIDNLSMRSLAAKLQVAPMTLYTYIDSKEDLLNQVADSLLDKLDIPPRGAGPWSAAIAAMMTNFYDLMVHQPEITRLLSSQRIISTGLTRFIDTTLEILIGAGLSQEASARSFMNLLQFTYGAASLAVSRSAPRLPHQEVDPYSRRRLDVMFQSGQFPNYAALIDTLLDIGTKATFELGLRRIIAGIAVDNGLATRVPDAG
jgi:AcrR family transcriptional regulator